MIDRIGDNKARATRHNLMENANMDQKKQITGHRPPTPSEIRFGYGATHYADFDREDWQKPDGTLKRWIKSQYDGLRYYRG